MAKIATKNEDGTYLIKEPYDTTDIDGNTVTMFNSWTFAQETLDDYQAVLDAVAQADSGVTEETQLANYKTDVANKKITPPILIKPIK